MLTLWNPLYPIKSKSDSKMSTKSYFDRLFEDTFDNAFHDLFGANSIGISQVKNEDGSLAISVDVPGIKEADLVIEVLDNILSIKGERKTATSSYTVSKSVNIPEGYDTDNIVANLSDGVLNLTMASKILPAKEVKKIPITSTNK